MRGYTDAARGNLALQQERATQQANIDRTKAESAVAVGTAPSRISAADTAAKSARFGFDQSQQKLAAQIGSTMGQDPEFISATQAAQQAHANEDEPGVKQAGGVIISKIAAARQQMIAQGVPPEVAEANASFLIARASQDPGSVAGLLGGMLRSHLGAESQNATQTPSPAMMNTGSAVVPVTTGNAANTGIQPGMPAGPATALTVSPSERETMQIDPATGKPYVQQKTPAGAIQTAPIQGAFTPGGKVGALQIDMNARHRDETQKAAEGSAQAITNLDEMSQELKRNPSMVGTTDWRRQFAKTMSGLGLGFGEEATQADIMNKLAARMKQAGNTDAANEIAGMASPNIKMTPAALGRVISLTRSQEQKTTAQAQFFGSSSPDDPDYQQKRNTWQQNADPRVWEFANASPEERKAFLKPMTPGQQEAIKQKGKVLEQIGVKF
jgi:hypothetical protein